MLQLRDYDIKYGRTAYEDPEQKLIDTLHFGMQFVVLSSLAVSCVQTQFPPPGDEDDFLFDGFCFAEFQKPRYSFHYQLFILITV